MTLDSVPGTWDRPVCGAPLPGMGFNPFLSFSINTK